MVVLRIARGVTDHFVGRWPEWLLSCMLMALGAKLLLSQDTFSSSPSFMVMAQLADENTWGFGICAIATTRIVALTLNGTFKSFARYSPMARSAFGCLSAFAWFSIALGLILGNPEGTGWPTYTGLMFGDIINSILAAGDAGAAQRKHRGGIRP